MFGIVSKEFCDICKRKPPVLKMNPLTNEWICDGGCENQMPIDNTRIKDTLIDSGNALESMPAERIYNHIESCIPPLNDDEEEEMESSLPPPPIDLNAARMEKEFPGMKEMAGVISAIRGEMGPEIIKAEIRKTASDIFVQYIAEYGFAGQVTPTDMDLIWNVSQTFWHRKPKDI